MENNEMTDAQLARISRRYRKNRNRTLIWNRTEPCRCGCMGRDPHHAKTFQRILKNVERFYGPGYATAQLTTDNGRWSTVSAVATVNLHGKDRLVYERILLKADHPEIVKDARYGWELGW